MNFVPYKDKIEIQPIKEEGILERMSSNYQEAGTVLAVGSEVTDIAVGDTLYFLSHGCWETAKVDGISHYVVPATSEYILGITKPDVAAEPV